MFTFFFLNDTPTTDIYTLSLHDALPISVADRDLSLALVLEREPVDDHGRVRRRDQRQIGGGGWARVDVGDRDRKSTRLNSSHLDISYAVLCSQQKRNKLQLDTCEGTIEG